MKSNELLSHLKTAGKRQLDDTVNTYRLLTPAQLQFRPGPRAWNMLECYEHLNRYHRYYLPAIGKALDKARPAAEQEVVHSWVGRKSIEAMAPANTKKQKTLRHLNPLDAAVFPDAVDEFVRNQEQLLALIGKCGGLDLNQRLVPLEFFRLIRLSIADALHFVIVHEERHFMQLERLRAAAGRPASPVLAV